MSREPALGLNECIAINLQSLLFICFVLNRCMVANCCEWCVCCFCSDVRKRVYGVELECNKQMLDDGGHN